MSTHLMMSTILTVPQKYSTIQSAIDAAKNSDTVLVSEGTYYENIRYKGKGIVVTSRYFITQDWNTVKNTVIDGSTCLNKDSASTVQFLNSEDSTTVLDGFTITGGTGNKWIFDTNVGVEGGGIILSSSSAIIKNNIITNNTTRSSNGVIGGGGGGISSMYGNPTIYNNVIFSNTSGYAGGIVLNWSKGKIRNNIIFHNTTAGIYGGGGIMIWQSPQNSGIVENNTIISNYSTATGGGIEISVTDATTIPVVKNNIVWGNRQATGSQIDYPQYITGYNDVENYLSGTNISIYPQLQANSFLLSGTSPCIDAGDIAAACNDIENPGHLGFAFSPSQGTVRNDIGAYGGLFAKTLTSIDVSDFRLSSSAISLQCSTSCQKTAGIELLNLSSKSLTIDSVTVSDTATFSLNKNFAGQNINLLSFDSIKIKFRPFIRADFYDTVRVYHHITGKTNPLKIAISATSNSAPFLNKSIPGQTAYVDQLFTFQIPDSTFLDPDIGDTLMYQVNGLPSWLSFNAQTHTFQGTPTQTVRLITIGITVNDLLITSASTTFRMAVLSASGIDDQQIQPKEYRMMQNYPNPFNPSTIIEYQVPTFSRVNLKVYDVLGREVALLVNEAKNAGQYSVKWDAPGMPSGIYFCRITTENFSQVKRMLLIK